MQSQTNETQKSSKLKIPKNIYLELIDPWHFTKKLNVLPSRTFLIDLCEPEIYLHLRRDNTTKQITLLSIDSGTFKSHYVDYVGCFVLGCKKQGHLPGRWRF